MTLMQWLWIGQAAWDVICVALIFCLFLIIVDTKMHVDGKDKKESE